MKRGQQARPIMEQVESQGLKLAESKWSSYCKGINNRWDRATTAILLENQDQYEQSIQETVLMRNPGIASLQRFTFPLIRVIFPNLIATELVSVQPMLSNHSSIFFMDFVYGSDKGATSAGTSMFENPDESYSSERVEQEQVASGDGAALSFSGNLAYVPARRNTIEFQTEIGGTPHTYTDDGAGNILDDGSGTLDEANSDVDYSTGAWNLTFTTGNPPDSGPITADYEFEMEGADAESIPQVDLVLTSSPVVARSRKLRTRWSLESAFNLRRMHGIEAETEIVGALAEELKFEIDRQIIKNLRRIASAGPTVTFDRTAPSGVSTVEHYESFIIKALEADQQVFQATRRAKTNWMVVGSQAQGIVESLDRFIPDNQQAGVTGARRIGTLSGRWRVYADPYFPDDEWMVGFKGDSFLEAGYAYAPYIPLYMTDTVTLDDFLARKGIGTMYGKKPINGQFYNRGKIVTSGTP